MAVLLKDQSDYMPPKQQDHMPKVFITDICMGQLARFFLAASLRAHGLRQRVEARHGRAGRECLWGATGRRSAVSGVFAPGLL